MKSGRWFLFSLAKIGIRYWPFGMEVEEYSWANGGTRYDGINGQEEDEEIFKGSYSAEYWNYDSRVGRRWNLDPVDQIRISNYAAFGNNPILFVDPYGDKFVNMQKDKVAAQQKEVAAAQAVYDEMIKTLTDQGEVITKRKSSKLRKKSGLKKAEKKLEKYEEMSAKTETFLSDFKNASPEEYKYFDELKDIDGNDVYINIDLAEGFHPKFPQMYAATRPLNFSWVKTKNDDGTITLKGLRKTNPDIKTDFYIRLFEKQSGANGDDTGWTFSSLMNELGDVKFMFTKIKTTADIKLWNETKNDRSVSYDNYKNNKKGAGYFSFQYSEDRVRELKQYKRSKKK